MQTLETNRPTKQPEFFDALASVRMIRADIDNFGDIRRETLEQIYDEELTYIAESLDKPHKTTFEIKYSPLARDLFNQRGDSLTESYQKGYEAAKKTANVRPIYKFHEQRCQADIGELEAIKELMDSGEAGEAIVVLSPFPEEAYRSYGKQNLEAIGYQPKRLLGFIRFNNKIDDETVQVTSITIDNSDLDSFRQVAKNLGQDIPLVATSDMYLNYRIKTTARPADALKVYDESMSRLFGGNFSAGRRKIGEQNAWEFITEQKQLCDYYFDELGALAGRDDMSEAEKASAKKALTVGFWARLNEVGVRPVEYGVNIGAEVYGALERAEARYETMVGCGGSMSAMPKTLLENSKENTFSFIFGSYGSEKMIFKSGKCRVKNCPSRPKTTKVGPCSVCVGCQHLFDQDKNPEKEYDRLKQQKKWKQNNKTKKRLL